MSADLAALLREARSHVKATADRTNARTTYEAALDLLARIDAALREPQKDLEEKA